MTRAPALDGNDLDQAVAKAAGVALVPTPPNQEPGSAWWLEDMGHWAPQPMPYAPSRRWDIGGPIIERAKISLYGDAGGRWMAQKHNIKVWGETILIAGMRCFVEWKRAAR